MDNLDTKILAALDADSRRSYTGIAKDLGVATATVHQRMRRLVDKGIIRGFSVDIDWEQVGLPVLAIVSISSRASRSLASIADDLAALPHIASCAAVTGEFDLLATVRAASPEHLGTLVDEIRMISNGTTRTVLVLSAYYLDRTPPLSGGLRPSQESSQASAREPG